MQDHATWSLSLGIWGGVRLRVHIVFVFFGVVTIFLGWHFSRADGSTVLFWLSCLIVLILGISVVLHEYSHRYMELRMGIHDLAPIMIGPLGGMTPIQYAQAPRQELLTSLAGPCANLFICLACLPALLFAAGGEAGGLISLLHPLKPTSVFQGETWIVLFKLMFWINWFLFLVNLLPVYPFDGGRVLRAILMAFHAGMDSRTATTFVARFAQIVSVGLLIAACLLRVPNSPLWVPTWFVLLLFGIFVLFAAQYEIDRCRDEQDHEEEFFCYDFSQGYTSLNRDVESPPQVPKGPLARWLAKQSEARQRQRQNMEQEEEKRMDEILSRLHDGGMKGLSVEDRRILDRVSARYRSRMDQKN